MRENEKTKKFLLMWLLLLMFFFFVFLAILEMFIPPSEMCDIDLMKFKT